MFFPISTPRWPSSSRVVRPGGRVCASVWAEPAANVWATIPGDAIADRVRAAGAAAGWAGHVPLLGPRIDGRSVRASGLHDVEEWDVPTALVAESPQQYWQLLTELTAPVVSALDQVDEAARKRIADKVIADARPFESDGAVRLPAKAPLHRRYEGAPLASRRACRR